MEKEKKTVEICVRVTPTEKKELQKKADAAHLSLSRYLVKSASDKKIMQTENILDLIFQIKKIGTNINQIAAVANSQKYINKPLLLKVIEHEKEIAGLLRQILEEVYNTEEHTLLGLEIKIDKLKNTVERMNDNGSS